MNAPRRRAAAAARAGHLARPGSVRSLRVAAQQQVEIAKALTLDAQLLLLDEPTAALGAEETEHLFAVIDQLRAEGVSFIYVSHRLEEIARIADRVVVLRDGRWVASHDTAQVPVVAADRGHGRPQPRAAVPGHGRTRRPARCCTVEGLTGDGLPRHVVRVRAGEILGIAGIVGAGRTELVRAIAGADPVDRRHVSVEGTAAAARRPGGRDPRRRGAGARGPQGPGRRARPADRGQHRRLQPRPARRGRLGEAGPRARGRRVGDRQAAGQGRAGAARAGAVGRQPAEGRDRQVAGAPAAA